MSLGVRACSRKHKEVSISLIKNLLQIPCHLHRVVCVCAHVCMGVFLSMNSSGETLHLYKRTVIILIIIILIIRIKTIAATVAASVRTLERWYH